MNRKRSQVVWPVAGILCSALLASILLMFLLNPGAMPSAADRLLYGTIGPICLAVSFGSTPAVLIGSILCIGCAVLMVVGIVTRRLSISLLGAIPVAILWVLATMMLIGWSA